MNLPHRKLQRLKNYDYSQDGVYFITICTYNHLNIFGKIDNGQMVLNEYGNISKKYIGDIPNRWIRVSISKYIIMSNHIHMIVEIDVVGTALAAVRDNGQSQELSIQGIIGATKSLITNDILSIYKTKNEYMGKVFQRSYYDHVIRNDAEYQKIWEYIDTNPLKWELDKYYI